MAKTKIKSISAPDQGINKYQPHHLINDREWADGNNIAFGVNIMKKVGGWKKFVSQQLDSRVLAIDNYYKFDGTENLMVVTQNKMYVFDPGTNTFIDKTGSTVLNGDTNTIVMTENIADSFIFTNEKCPIMYWDNTMDSIAALPGLNEAETGLYGTYVNVTAARCMLNFANFLILGNTTESGDSYPQRIRWSTLGDPTVWHNDADGNGQAGYLDLSDGVDWVQNMKPLGNYLVIYKERSIHVISYVGGEAILDRRPAIIGTGLLAPKAIIDLGTEHIFIGPDNIYSFDLIEPKIAGDNISKEFFSLLKPQTANLISGFFIEEVPEAWFTFVSKDSPDDTPDKALVYNTDTKAWSIRDLPFTAYGYYTVKEDKTIDNIDEAFDSIDDSIDSVTNLANAPINIAGDADGYIYELSGSSKDGSDLACFARSKLFDFGRPDLIKRLKRIQLMISREDEYNLTIRVGTADNVEEDIVWSDSYYMNLSKTFPPWVDIDISGRYLCFEFSTENKYQPFKLSGYQLSYQERGDI